MSIHSSIRILWHVHRSKPLPLSVSHLLTLDGGVSSLPVSQRCLHVSPSQSAVVGQGFLATKDSILRKTLRKIKFYFFDRSKIMATSYLLYETVADNIPFMQFFEEFSMPDTFNSWFLVTELHLWMLMVKAMEEVPNGRTTRNFMVQALWKDVALKGKKLGSENSSMAEEQIQALGDQFQAALLTYDEGLLSDDKVLASALWRRFFGRNCDDPEKLERMVKYVRRQMLYLHNLPLAEFKAQKIKWLPLDKT